VLIDEPLRRRRGFEPSGWKILALSNAGWLAEWWSDRLLCGLVRYTATPQVPAAAMRAPATHGAQPAPVDDARKACADAVAEKTTVSTIHTSWWGLRCTTR
jgi:hypothetical protein